MQRKKKRCAISTTVSERTFDILDDLQFERHCSMSAALDIVANTFINYQSILDSQKIADEIIKEDVRKEAENLFNEAYHEKGEPGKSTHDSPRTGNLNANKEELDWLNSKN